MTPSMKVGQATTSSAFVRFAATGTARRRLLCLPYAGGGPSIYRLWPKSLPADIEVIVAKVPGRDPSSRQAPLDSIADIVAVVVAATTELQADDPLPFALFGHSMGALVAFETAVVLERAGGPSPDILFVSGRRPPDELHDGQQIHALADELFLDRMQDLYGGVPDVIRNEPDLLRMLLPTLRADIRALETYAPDTHGSVRCQVRVYGGLHDTHPRPSQLPGWQRVAERPVTVRAFDGGHFYLNDARDELVADIAATWNAEHPAVTGT
jgi:medium-chain acyl-[acyl-carrier-protein] hydrolase